MITIHSRQSLQAQTYDSRRRNIAEEIFRTMEMAYDVPDVMESERLCDIGFTGDRLARLGKSMEARFPFFPSPDVATVSTVGDLINLITRKVGA